MKICIVGKFPPIEGGVSMHTYRYAHALAQQGHQVHVVTNAKEVQAPYRMFMREEDWARCDEDYGEGFVRVHWTDPFDRKQSHIPASNPFVSKLTSIGAQVCVDHDIEVVFSFYMEPYGVAGHLIAEMAELPHVVKTAGSDAGRLWQHRQFQPLYNHIFKSADFIVAASMVYQKLRELGVPVSRFRPDREFKVPEDVFCAAGPVLDVELLCQQIEDSPEHAPLQRGRVREGIPYIGVYGKLGDSKGTFALLRAVARLKENGQDVGILVMGHEPPKGPVRFCDAVSELSLDDHVVQLPFLPHWRVPEFIRRCVAVCCLEQDFPITIHTPIVAREILCCGTPLIASTEMIHKLPHSDRLVDRYNCFAVNDVNDVNELSAQICNVLDLWDGANVIGQRGRDYVVDAQKSLKFPDRMEQTLALAISGQTEQATGQVRSPPQNRFVLTCMAIDAMNAGDSPEFMNPPGDPEKDMEWAESVLRELSDRIDGGAPSLAPIHDAVKFDICMAQAASAGQPDAPAERFDNPLFRLNLRNGASYADDVKSLIPWRLPNAIAQRFGHDVNSFLQASATRVFPADIPERETFAIFLGGGRGRGVMTIVLDAVAGRLLELCDGCSSIQELGVKIAAEIPGRDLNEAWALDSIERFFEIGLIGLRDAEPVAAIA